MIKTYSDLIMLKTFAERYKYLRINGNIGLETFGWDRYLNQMLYHSKEWQQFRREIVLRDNGCDLGLEDHPIFGRGIIIHHINPITKAQILNRDTAVFDPENAISCSHKTHMAIHYGSLETADIQPVARSKNDTCPWRH